MNIKLAFLLVLACSLSQGTRTKQQRITGRRGMSIDQVTISDEAELRHAPVDQDIFDVNQGTLGDDLIDGDIYRQGGERNAIVDKTRYWPSFTIPVSYSPALGLLAAAGIDDARLEYEMRTCFTFPDRTTEQDYLYFEPLSGCYSSVGKVGGQQTISIGSGCEKRSTIQHEMMHAIGIYHQQSRTDRDDYVIIKTENIDDGKVHNFNTYDYTIVDQQRVPYDYNSVMHYGDTSFSNNGEATIVTRDPAFQDVIGQRRTFSEGDATMINRMYPCADPLRVSYTCGFEVTNVCGYVQDTDDDDIDFERFIIGESTSSNPLVPDFDNTLGVPGRGSFMLLTQVASPAGEVANMVSMRLKTAADTQCLEFSYYMDLDAMSDAELTVKLGLIDPTNGEVLKTTDLVTINGDHQEFWNVERFSFNAVNSEYKLIFSAKSGKYADDVIAVDDIHVQDKACETAYFKIQEFSSLLASTSKGDGVYGPLLYTDEGYAFKTLFYPHGSNSAADGYVSMYFALAQGDNDDSLQWPFYNQVVKMSVVDQGPEKLTNMNQFSNYLTSSSGGSVWDKPDSAVSSAWGYSNFMPLSDITNTRNFVKNDAIVISINVRDMNSYTRDQRSLLRSSQQFAMNGGGHGQDEHEHPPTSESNGIHINIINPDVNVTQVHEAPSDDEYDDVVSKATAFAIALVCSLLIFVVMAIVLIMIVSQQRKAIDAMASMRHNASTVSDFENHSYEAHKI